MLQILMIDNYDSFTYNLVHLFMKFPIEIKVLRNDVVDSARVLELEPDLLVISPGPKSPDDCGNCKEIIRETAGKIPVFGVCLGMQIINEVFGGKTAHAPLPVHGKTSMIKHRRTNIFSDLPSPFQAARYHSLIVEQIQNCLEVTAWSEDGIPMALTHRDFPIYAVQFHPESFLTEHGEKLVQNLLSKENLNGNYQAA